MGAVLLTETVTVNIPDNPHNFLKMFYNKLREQSRIEDGADPYSGGWFAASPAIHVLKRKPFEDYQAAQTYVEQTCEKHGSALAVPYVGPCKKHDAASMKIFQKIKLASIECEDRVKKIHKEIQGTKSKTKGCPKCGSSITRSYIDLYCDCPVCGERHGLMSASQRKYLDNAVKKLEAAKKQKRKYSVGTGICYIVAAVAAE
jgi:hypothetical protein